jgi:ABC-type phosphate transport system substrate-binding protein
MTLWNGQGIGRLAKIALISACIFVFGVVAAARDVAIVTNKDSPLKAVKAADLARMIKTSHKRPDGYDLTVILTDPSSPEMQIVAQKLLSLTTDEFKKLIDATNKTHVTFHVVSGDDEAIRAMQSNPAAIGLVNVYSINSNVEVLKIDGKLPLEPGYILHSQ